MDRNDSRSDSTKARPAGTSGSSPHPGRGGRRESDPQMQAIVRAQNSDPFAVLGPHRISRRGQSVWAVRFFIPWAAEAHVAIAGGLTFPAERIHPDGFFESVLTLSQETLAPS